MTEAAAEAGPSRTTASQAVDPLARAVFAVLVLACFGAFFLTQRLKHTPTIVTAPRIASYFTPYPGGHVPLEAISFKLSTADEVTVTIIDPQGNDVATLVRELPVARYKTLSLRWTGRRGVAHGYSILVSRTGRTHSLVPRIRGRLAAPGEYRVRVTLRHHGVRNLPRSFELVRR